MNKKEREQSKVFEQVRQGVISRVEASRRLRSCFVKIGVYYL